MASNKPANERVGERIVKPKQDIHSKLPKYIPITSQTRKNIIPTMIEHTKSSKAAISNSEKIQLKALNQRQTEIVLGKYGYSNIATTLKEAGSLNGNTLVSLDLETLTDVLSIKKFQAKTFLKWIEACKEDGFSKENLTDNTSDSNLVNNPGVSSKSSLSPEKQDTTIVINSINEINKDTNVDTSMVMSKYIKRNEYELSEIIHLSRELKVEEGLHILQFPSPGTPLSKFTSCKIPKQIFNLMQKTPVKPLYLIEEKVSPIEWNDDRCKRIILLGQTGAGKSTLLNAMVNFAVGINMSDNVRFQIVVDPLENTNDQTKSQTSEITRYRIRDHGLGYKLEIWDTPGFGDTRGIKFDEEIKNQIRHLIGQEESCHAVCFVVKASDARLTPTQHYIINNFLSFFSIEAKESIYALITNADESKPLVLGALKDPSNDFPFSDTNCFAFNNSALFKPRPERNSVTSHYWNEGMGKLSLFFKQLSNQTPFSFTSSKEVIKMRSKLSRDVIVLYQQIGRSVILQQDLNYQYNEYKKNQSEIEKTGYFEKRVQKSREEMYSWLFFWRTKTIYYYETEVDEELKAKFAKATDKKLVVENHIKEYQLKVDEANENMLKNLSTIIRYIISLKTMSFVNSAWKMSDYLDTLIEAAKLKDDLKLVAEYEKLKNKQKIFEDLATLSEKEKYNQVNILEKLRCSWNQELK